ncbi:high-affinity Fe2+/Pb2+ permease [Paenibacillus rhizosphaerae]|uniref:High-affinity Fe2+/Pb2+ permease n=1 Tax=Paenibacillus rhizosphaerae TaxID=297318 RepID=A0A839TXG4_9BACL|nr:hypothetical protein [Paenibacillus rhizosphaerae]MBB3131342.1 high-affinity Fe2+/Pb2+ permease [Paenibacillus rhizosphaerae]
MLQSMVAGLHNAFFVGLCLAVLALVISFFIRRTHAAKIRTTAGNE